jgi:Winged helix-turn helix
MKPPIFVRSRSEKERETLQASLRSKDAFTLRRSQMLLASSKGNQVPRIAENLGCGQQTVRDAIHDFDARGVDALAAKSSRPKRTRDAFDEESAEALRELLRREVDWKPYPIGVLPLQCYGRAPMLLFPKRRGQALLPVPRGYAHRAAEGGLRDWPGCGSCAEGRWP